MHTKDSRSSNTAESKDDDDDNIFGNLTQESSEILFLVINNNDHLVAEKVVIYEKSGKDMMKYANEKRKSNCLDTLKARGEFLRQITRLNSMQVFDENDNRHTANPHAPWFTKDFQSCNLPSEDVFNRYKKSKGVWLEMRANDFNIENIGSIEGRKTWLEKLYANFDSWNITFKALNPCDDDGNVYGKLISRKPEVTFMVIVDGTTVRHVCIHDEKGMDLHNFIKSKEKSGMFTSNKERGMFQRDELNIQSMSVYDPDNTYHKKYEGAAWYATSFEESNFHDKSLFDAYKRTKGGWYEMTAEDFHRNNLTANAGQKAWINKISEKYENWNIKFKKHLA